MFLLKKIIAAWVVSPAGLGLLNLVGLGQLIRGKRRFGAAIVVIVAVATVMLSIPAVSHSLMRWVEIPPTPLAQIKDVQAIVILGGGIHAGAAEFGQAYTVSSATLVRIRYGAWLAKQLHLPVLVSGGSVFGGTAEAELMASTLHDEFGVQVRWTEAKSKDTAENAALSASLLKRSGGVSRIALVSHAIHMRRAETLFKNTGLTVTPASTLGTASAEGFEALLPSAGSLQDSFSALHEIVGNLVQR